MERKNKSAVVIEETTVKTSPIFRWKVVGGSPFHGGGHRIYKPGEVFKATEEEVPQAFRDVIIKIDHMSVQEQEKPISGKVATYSLKEKEKVNPDDDDEDVLYDVINHKGKVINEVALSKEKADSFIKDLME